jgi:hypothetical protein
MNVFLSSDGVQYDMTLHQQPLDELLQQLREILQSIPVLESQGYRPPIIEGNGYTQNRDPIIGLRIFKDSVTREVEVLEQVSVGFV